MVRSQGCTHLVQYMYNKPTKWEFKLWVIVDPSGYTLDFNINTGKTSNVTNHGLSTLVVIELVTLVYISGIPVVL